MVKLLKIIRFIFSVIIFSLIVFLFYISTKYSADSFDGTVIFFYLGVPGLIISSIAIFLSNFLLSRESKTIFAKATSPDRTMRIVGVIALFLLVIVPVLISLKHILR